MADLTVWPTDGAGGSVASEARWRKMARLWVGTGVELKGGMLKPTLGAGSIGVADGNCWLDGHYAELAAGTSIPVTSNGLLVIRFTPADNHAELLYRDSVTDPTQTDASYELPLARMTGGVMVDLRVYSTAVAVAPNAATPVTLRAQVAGDYQPRAGVGLDSAGRGTVVFGAGASTAPDASITRTGAGALTVTGALNAVTKAVDTTTTDVATTAFVVGQASAVVPATVDDTAAAVGVSKRFARADHRHALAAGIYDTAGNASRLNPMQVFTWYEDHGLTVGDGVEYRLDGAGWKVVGSNSAPAIPWDHDGLAAIGGTVQWRWYFAFVMSGALGGTGRSMTLKYVNVTEAGGAGAVTGVVGGSLSFVDGAGVKAIDTGWQTAPGGSGMIVPQIRSDRSGGSAGTASRTSLIVAVRNH